MYFFSLSRSHWISDWKIELMCESLLVAHRLTSRVSETNGTHEPEWNNNIAQTKQNKRKAFQMSKIGETRSVSFWKDQPTFQTLVSNLEDIRMNPSAHQFHSKRDTLWIPRGAQISNFLNWKRRAILNNWIRSNESVSVRDGAVHRFKKFKLRLGGIKVNYGSELRRSEMRFGLNRFECQ